MVIAGLAEQGETPAGHLQVVLLQFQGLGLLKTKYKGDGKFQGKVPKALVHLWVIIRFLVPRGRGAVMLSPRVFQTHGWQEVNWLLHWANFEKKILQSPPPQGHTSANKAKPSNSATPFGSHFLLNHHTWAGCSRLYQNEIDKSKGNKPVNSIPASVHAYWVHALTSLNKQLWSRCVSQTDIIPKLVFVVVFNQRNRKETMTDNNIVGGYFF